VALAVQTINVAHQFLNKPCDIDELVRVIRKTISLRRLLGRGELCALANDTVRMPSMPGHYVEITHEIAKQDASVDRVAAIVQEDPAMTVTILRLVNSGFFGRPSRVLTVKEAIGLLGLELLRSLTLTTGLFVKFESTPSFSIERFAARSARVAWLARMMADDAGAPQNVREQTFVSAMLCDIGLLLLHTSMPAYANYVDQARSQNTDIAEIERIMIGADHAEIGAYLMALWGFEDDIVEAIVHHHHPRNCAGDSPKAPLAFVHCADALTDDPDHCSKREVDVVFLASMGLDGYLPHWREMAKTPRTTEA
jgi:HD-like signal output (HDOD) protein